MSFAEFELKRTLTDVLEDELYHLPSNTNKPNATQHSADLMDVESANLDTLINTQSLIPGTDPLLSSNNTNYSGIFSSYADPTLTTAMPTLSSISPEPQSVQASSPASSVESPVLQQKTVNLNNLIKRKPSSPTTHNNHNNLLDVKISHDNTLYTPIVDDNEYMLYYDDIYASKLVNIPLRDNNNALNMENAKVMFDQEFSDDDDDDDDDDDKVFDDNHTATTTNNAQNSRFAISNDYPVYYMDDIHAPASNELDSSAIIDDDDDDDEEEDGLKHTGLLNEDELYNIMIRDNSHKQTTKNNIFHNNNSNNNNKRRLQNHHHHHSGLYSSNNAVETLVFNNDLLNLNRSKSLSLKQKPKLTLPQSNHLDTVIRKPLSNVNSNSNNNNINNINNNNNNIQYNLDNDTTINKKIITTQRSKFTTSSNNNNPNEIFTCRLVNLITSEPCMAEFSRSYDLTRHQNTIHAKKKIVFRCSECIKSLGHDGYSKTFSRLDALTRHIKSKHEDLTPEQRQVVTKYAKENIGYVM